MKRSRQVPLQPWNTRGYRLAKSHPMFLDVYPFADVAALDAESGSLLAFPGGDAPALEIIRGFPFESGDTETATLHVERRELGMRAKIVHTASGFPGEPHFALDVANQRILEVPALTAIYPGGAGVRAIEVDWPDGVRLTAESRVAVLPRDLQKHELMTPALFVSAPASHVVLRVDRASGKAAVIAGQIGKAGAPGQHDQRARSASRRDTLGRAAHALLGSPQGLFFDEEVQKLLIADSLNGAIYAVSLQTGMIELVATSDPEARRDDTAPYFAELKKVQGLLLYRFATLNVDETRLVRNGIDTTPGWGKEPVTLVFWDDTSRVVTAWLNTDRKNRKPESTNIPGVRSALIHPSGEVLLLAAEHVGLMKHPVVLTETHFSNDSASKG